MDYFSKNKSESIPTCQMWVSAEILLSSFFFKIFVAKKVKLCGIMTYEVYLHSKGMSWNLSENDLLCKTHLAQ